MIQRSVIAVMRYLGSDVCDHYETWYRHLPYSRLRVDKVWGQSHEYLSQRQKKWCHRSKNWIIFAPYWNGDEPTTRRREPTTRWTYCETNSPWSEATMSRALYKTNSPWDETITRWTHQKSQGIRSESSIDLDSYTQNEPSQIPNPRNESRNTIKGKKDGLSLFWWGKNKYSSYLGSTALTLL